MMTCLSNQGYAQSYDWYTIQEPSSILFSISEGLKGPEGVRYDEKSDVFFISNLNGRGNQKDGNGFISKVDHSGNVISSKFMQGTNRYPLHAPKGMFIIEDELFAVDINGVHVFNRKTGTHLTFIDFSNLKPGLLNDISADQHGILYVTDTRKPRVYKVKNNLPEIFIDTLPIYPNGITKNPVKDEFILATWTGDSLLYSFETDGSFKPYRKLNGGYYDGLEFIGENLIIASQLDSTIRHSHQSGSENLFIRVPARPADIGVDTKRYRIAVPYVVENRVDIWEIKRNQK